MNTNILATSYRLVQLSGAAAARDLNARNQAPFSEFVEPGRVDAKFFDGSAILDLGSLGGPASFAVAVNGPGQVTGSSTIADSGSFHPFLWSRSGGMMDLGLVPGAVNAFANDLNNRAKVTGVALFDEEPSARPFLWSRQTGMVDLGPVNGAPGVGVQINDAGRIMGQASGQEAVFSWTQEAGMQVIGSPAGFSILAGDMNAAGQIVGGYNTATRGRAFLWTPGEGLLDLGDPAAGASAINDWEMVVGTRFDNGHAYAWTHEDGFVDLGALGGGVSVPTDVNNNGQVVGWSLTADVGTHAFLWTPEDGMLDLNAHVSNAPPGLVLAVAQKINASGTILAEASGGGLYLLLAGSGRDEPPVVTQIQVGGVLDVNMPLSFSANFTDVDMDQTHTATWSWGDGTQQAGAVVESNGAGSVSGTHTYFVPGLYTVTLTVTDSGGKRTVVRRIVGVGVPAPFTAANLVSAT